MKVVNLSMVLFVFFLSHNSWASQQRIVIDAKEAKAPSGLGKNVTWKRLAVVRPAGAHDKEMSELEALLRAKIEKKLDCESTIEIGMKLFPVRTTALHCAIDDGDAKAIAAVIKKNPSLIDSVDKIDSFDADGYRNVCGRKPLAMLVEQCGNESWVPGLVKSMLQKRPYLVDTTIDHGGRKYTLLQWAVGKQYEALCRVLLACGARVNAWVDGMLYTPLHFACACGNFKIFQMLMDAGADATVTDCYSATPLHYAAGKSWLSARANEVVFFAKPKSGASDATLFAYREQGKLRRLMIKKLVEKGADLLAEDAYGNRPIECARDCEHLSTYTLLFELEAARTQVAKKGVVRNGKN